MEVNEKRGTLLLDEVALSEATNLNQRTMQLDGFVDLGSYTPEKDLNTRADHALVFMFQPFQGDWVQVIGCFLSRSATISEILHKLIIECVLLLENAGFKVDAVTCDGAQWNRSAWKLFGIEDYKFSCQHPHDPSRRLWFLSDFSHLLKNLRNKIMETPFFWTPDGFVYRKYWEALLTYENSFKANLSVTYKLTPGHIKPEQYQKMNVLLAMKLFSKRLRVTMEMYADNCPELRGCESTIAFMERVDRLITAMTSRTPMNALRADPSCEMRKAITDFIKYLREWEEHAIEEKKRYKDLRESLDEDQLPGKFFFAITPSTLTGLKISLGATLELIDFLHNECNYDYLMTIRLTQDALEKFFGIMRSACGCNDHSDVMLFAQVYRLLCSYSLATPPKGSNVTAGELLQSLMQTKDSLALASAPKNEWLKKLDAIVENGINEKIPKPNERLDDGIDKDGGISDGGIDFCDFGDGRNFSTQHGDEGDTINHSNISDGRTNVGNVPSVSRVNTSDEEDEEVHQVQQPCNRKPFESLVDDSDSSDDNDNQEKLNISSFQDSYHDHDYDVVKSSDEIIAYIAGYMVRKTSRYSKCFTCIETLQSTSISTSGRDKFIELMSDGALIYPSENLFLLIQSLEEDVLSVVGTKTIKCNTMHQILVKISLRQSLPTVGCAKHTKQLMVKVINYFIVMRGHFLAKLFNKNLNQRKILTRKHRKTAKLA
ncbi:uncharacterized protein LOC123272579 isoform X2 [Cotesia glomerata]|uniref:uncharacterized protein LOC123272579 isoform X2 n=1 Tax=Cotesia glomerata TaxID=32391 RepID=UPI001D0217F6|nr:uncharacterized protein LOC123272579 isoform X2 [Cotesia glomerata]